MELKLGRKPAVRPAALKDLAVYATGVLPAPPAEVKAPAVAYPIDGNNRYGDCVAEGTLVQAPGARGGLRVAYCGPMVTICTASGRQLTVTPNHGVLTPRGFVVAGGLNKGDHLVCAAGREGGDRTRHLDLDQAPAPIEQVVAALPGSRARAMPAAVDLHGDERFVDGDVEVVTPNRLLDREGEAALRQVQREQQVVRACVAERPFHRARSRFHRHEVRRTPTLRRVRAAGDGGSLGGRAALVLKPRSLRRGSERDVRSGDGLDQLLVGNRVLTREPQGGLAALVTSDRGLPFGATALMEKPSVKPLAFGERPKCHAGLQQARAGGPAVDPELPAELIEAGAGLVSADEITNVEWGIYDGHLYDISTDRRWYTANGIVAHNCVMAGTDHLVRAWRALYGDAGVLPLEVELIAKYLELSPGDEGLVEAEVLKLWQGPGLGLYGGQIHSYCPVPPKDGLQLYQAIAFYGGAMFGIECPQSAQEQFENGEPWTFVPGSPVLGGHCIVALGYDNHGNIECATWGGIAIVTPAFLAHFLQEAWVILSHQLVEAKGDQLGLDLASLEQDIARV